MQRTPKWMLFGAGAMLVATTAVQAQVRTNGSGIPITKDVSVLPGDTSVTVVSGGEISLTPAFDLSLYANRMNEKMITAHMIAGDSLEIQMAQLAQARGTSPSVRNYATTLVNDHTAHLAKTWEIITDEDVGVAAMPYDVEVIRARQELANLRSMSPGANWDAEFLRFQAMHHQHEIDILNSNIKNAHDDDLEDHIEDSVETLTRHRDSARSIATSLGVTTY